MDAATFNEVFDEEIGERVRAAGGSQRGRSVFLGSETLQLAVLRTEHRWMPPPKLTIAIRHQQMRDMAEEVPTNRSNEPNDYPVKVAPSDLGRLLQPAWRYDPLGSRSRSDTFDYKRSAPGDIRHRLSAVGEEVVELFPLLSARLTAAFFLEMFTAQGHDWWSERMWIEDMRALI